MGGRWRRQVGRLVLGVALAGATCSADDKTPSARETTTDKITIPGTVVEFTLVKLPAGKVTIKDKDGKEKAYNIKPIWIGRTEVTWDEFDIFWQALDLPQNQRAGVKSDQLVIRSRPSVPYAPPDRNFGHDGSPAGSMFFREAKNYCEWLSSKTRHTYRLPTEAEWEYACRAGGPPFKPDKEQLKKVAWFYLNSDEQTHPVAQKEPNVWGLYDMLGNVAEWVTLMDGGEAVAGGSYKDEAEGVHSGAREKFSVEKWQKRDSQEPKGRSWLSDGEHVGFRLVRED
jgi:formylglycine-generating enzyme required for sulfatase activity